MKRIVFNFDDKSLSSLQKVTKRGQFSSMGGALRESVELFSIIQEESLSGFSELLVRSATQEKKITVPSLHK